MIFGAVIATICAFLFFRYFTRKFTIPSISKKYILVSGCDSGFGFLLVQSLDKLGIPVFAGCLTDTGIRRVASTCSQKTVAFHLDITSEDSITTALQMVKEAIPNDEGLWALINNAGILGPLGLFDWITVDDYRKVMEVNLYGHISMVTTFLPLLRMSRGRIVITTSIMGRLGGPMVPAYVASKFALEGFCDTIRVQLMTSKVSVHIIEPGSHKTEMTDDDVMIKSFRETFSRTSDEVKAFYGHDYCEKVIKKTESMKFEAAVEGPQPVVDAYIHAVTSRFPKNRYVIGKFTNIIFWPLTHLPEVFGDSFFSIAYPKPEAILDQKP